MTRIILGDNNTEFFMSSLPALFLPGTLCDERVWMPVWKHLRLQQRRYVPLQWANAIEDMLSLTGDRVLEQEQVHLIGYSMGGYIAALWALENPAKVASLTLIGYDSSGLTAAEETRRKQMLGMLKNGTFDATNPQFLSRFVHPSFMENDAVAGVVASMGKDLGKGTLIAHTQATTPRKSLTQALSKATFPIHIITASEDKVAEPEGVKRMVRAISPTSHTMFDGTAHMLPLERPDELADALQKILDANGK